MKRKQLRKGKSKRAGDFRLWLAVSAACVLMATILQASLRQSAEVPPASFRASGADIRLGGELDLQSNGPEFSELAAANIVN